jgi:hypothetical protein
MINSRVTFFLKGEEESIGWRTRTRISFKLVVQCLVAMHFALSFNYYHELVTAMDQTGLK